MLTPTKRKSGWLYYIRHRRFQNKVYYPETEGHYIIIKGLVHQEDVTILNVYALMNGSAKYKKQKLIELKDEIEKSTALSSPQGVRAKTHIKLNALKGKETCH